jgi:hypothetical protein
MAVLLIEKIIEGQASGFRDGLILHACGANRLSSVPTFSVPVYCCKIVENHETSLGPNSCFNADIVTIL